MATGEHHWRRRAMVAAALMVASLLLAPGTQDAAQAAVVPGSSAWLETLDRGNTYRLVVSGIAGDRVLAAQVYGRPALSPDGTRIAYTAPLTDGSDGRYALFVADVDGANLRRISAPAIGDFDPAWSPDGRTIAVSRDELGNFEASCCRIWLMAADGSSQRRLPNVGNGRQPSFAPYGTNIVYTAPDGIRIAGVSGAGNRLLAGNSTRSWPTFSPDGLKIAVVRRIGPSSGTVELLSPAGGSLGDTSAGSGGGLPEAPVFTSNTTLMHLNVWGEGEDGRTRAEVRRTTIGGSSVAIYRRTRPMFYFAWTGGVPCPNPATSPPASPPVPAPAIVRLGSWHLRSTQTSGPGESCFTYGLPRGDYPLTGDWDGDGTRTPGVFSNGQWHLRNSNFQGGFNIALAYGQAGDIPIVGDWDGNSTDTVGVRRGGDFHLRNSNTSGPGEISFRYGRADDLPVTGDWNGDDVVTVGVYRAGTWHLTNSHNQSVGDISTRFGRSTDRPVVADWDGNGTETIGVFRDGAWFLSSRNDTTDDYTEFTYGRVRDNPVVWQ